MTEKAKLMRYVLRDSGYVGPNGEFSYGFSGTGRCIHLHAHTAQIMAALQAEQAHRKLCIQGDQRCRHNT